MYERIIFLQVKIGIKSLKLKTIEEFNKMSKLKKYKKGITLMSLVITIVVILILAGVSIAMLIGENSILKQASNAKKQTEIANEKERIQLAVLSSTVNSSNTELSTDKLQKALQKEFKDKYGILFGENEWIYIGEHDSYLITKTGDIKSIHNYRIYGNSQYSKLLPSEYQQVEYLESAGDQYINTDVWISEKTKLELDMQLITADGDQKFLGTYGVGGVCLGTLSHKWRFGGSTWSKESGTASTERLLLVAEKNTFSFGNETFTSSTYISSNNQSPLFLFGVAYNGNLYWTSKLRVFHFNVYENNSQIRNFIPCYKKEASNNIPGLYDLTNNTFYTNQGKNSFILGDDVDSYSSVGTKNDNNTYTIPVKILTTLGEKSLVITLNSPLRKVSDVADYIDLKEQKVIRYISEDYTFLDTPIEESIEIYNLPDIKNILSISVETDIPPSKIEICE